MVKAAPHIEEVRAEKSTGQSFHFHNMDVGDAAHFIRVLPVSTPGI
jgi:hypothetical protein